MARRKHRALRLDRWRHFPPAFRQYIWIDRNLRTPHIQTWFGGIEQQISRSINIEVSQTGALGRKLISSDLVNRPFSVPLSPTNPNGYLNPNLPADIVYRSNSGSSDYAALSGAFKDVARDWWRRSVIPTATRSITKVIRC